MGANDIQQSLLDAMQLLSSKAANSTNAAIIIKGEIVEELDSSTHQYSISYGGAVYNDAYAISNVSYPISTIVHVLIPDGNFDNKKIIMTSVTPAATDFVAESESDLYIPISDNLFGGNQNIDLKSWIDDTETLDIDFSHFNLLFQDYLTANRNFVFSADIKTEIDINHQNTGNYGLILNLPFTQSNSEGTTSQVWRSYIMDVSTMQGNPYAYNEYQKINLYYTVDDTLKYDTTRTPYITAFTQDFGYTEPRTDIDYDIHIRNISMNIIDVLTEAESTGYYLSLVANDGNYFLNGIYTQNKILKPILKINSKESKITSWDCYWFVEDTSIDITSEGYSPIGGLGWKCINKKTNVTYDNDGNKTFQYITNNYTYTVTPEDVIYALRYKCVLVKDEVVVSGSIKLKNLNSDIITSLISATGSNTFIENIGTVKLLARIYYPGITDNNTSDTDIYMSWQRFDRYGKYLDNNFYYVIKYNEKIIIDGKQYYETEIDFPCSKIEKLNNINCTFYSRTVNNGTVVQNNLGTERIIITTSADFTYGLNVVGGDVLYKYDADGDSPLVANYDGPISSRVKTIDPITYSIFKPDGSELDDIEYLYVNYRWSFPKNSMMKLQGYNTSQLDALEQDDDYYYITGWGKSNLNYTILDTYNKKKSNNSILISVNFDGNILNGVAIPKFLKDGEGGTNGSKYSVVLTYNDYAYGERDENGKIRKLQCVYIAGAGWRVYDPVNNTLIPFGTPTLVPLVYRDGERITSGYSIDWSMFDPTQTNPYFGVIGGVLKYTASWENRTDISVSIVECAITINENSDTNSREVIYAYYPIEITRLINSTIADKVIPNIDGGFDEVVYASDGTNPQYDNTNPFECVDNLYNNDEGDYYDYRWGASNNLKISSTAGSGPIASIKPVTKFDNGLTKNYVTVTLTMSNSKRAAIQTVINELGTKITETNNLIAFYQHNQSHLLDFLQKFDYNKYIEYLNEGKNLLSYRYEMINYIPLMKNILEEMNSYCIENEIKIADFNYTRYYSNYLISLNNAYKSLYLLGSTRELSDINDLSGVLIEVDTDRITRVYGAAVAQQLNNFALTFNSLISNKYQVTYTKLIQQSGGSYILQSEYNAIKNFTEGLDNLVEDSDLSYLTKAHDNNDASQEFINLQTQLITLVKGITDNENGILISYANYKNDLLDKIINLLQIYLNTDYQTSYYENINTKLNNQLTDYENQKASYETMLLPASANYIIHVKPIVMVYNRYELSNINGWNGSKLYIDSQNNEYLLAPQVGAGAKKNGLFTGVIMGVKQFNANNTQHIGLFGYGEGIQSFFANAEDGSFIMGKSGSGQIIADPSQSKALLYSSTYWKNYNNDGKPNSYSSSNKSGKGMLIDLTTPLIHLADTSGKIYSGDHTTLGSTNEGFYISQDGLSIGSSFVISANGQSLIEHDGSSIGKWKVVTNNNGQAIGFKSNDGTGIFMDSINSHIVLGSSTGKIYSGNHITLDSTNEGFYLANDGLSIGNSIRVNSADNGSILVGRLTGSRHWTISGNTSNSFIAYGTTTLNSGSNSVYIGTNGISLGSDKFWVTNDGEFTSKSGHIAGWEITATELKNNGITISSNGNIEGDNWKIQRGSATFNNLTANGEGNIAGWNINEWGLQSPSNSMTIRSEGSLYGPNGSWSINSNGNATFNNIVCNYTWSFGSGRNTWSSNSGFSFGWGGLNGNATISLGALSPSYDSGNGISVGTDGSVSINGSIYAKSGHIGGNFIVDGTVIASGIDASKITTGTLSADRIAATSITASKIDLSTLDTQYMQFRGRAIGSAKGYLLNDIPTVTLNLEAHIEDPQSHQTVQVHFDQASASINTGGGSTFNVMGFSQ